MIFRICAVCMFASAVLSARSLQFGGTPAQDDIDGLREVVSSAASSCYSVRAE
ncbi:MAG: hypothetical protein GF350_01240 [Chitinivibrionales bacterium]|nr:hypothetical protein [Chitinivibrionales bacterium]